MKRAPCSPVTRGLFAVAFASLLSLGCESPEVKPTADGRQNTRAARIEGSLVVQSRARGNAVVFLYHADTPPPPQGSGRPLAFTIIPAEELFGPALGDNAPGPFTAPFALSLVQPGRYVLRGFIDADTCRFVPQPCHVSDFNPWYGVTSEPNAGDVGGGSVDPTNGATRVLEVTTDADGWPVPLTGVSVSFADSATVPFDRPAFQVAEGREFDTASTSVKVLTLTPQQFTGAVDQRPPGFWVQFVDANRDGVPDDANNDGIPDFWPRVVVRKLADDVPGIVDENDLNRDGVVDEEGVDYARVSGGKDGKPDVVVLAAGLVPDPLLAALRDEQGNPRPAPVFVPQLRVGIQNRALDARDPAAPAPLSPVPPGRYSVTLVQSTGQTWRVPNELDPTLADAAGLPGAQSQSFVLEVR
ncbi:hypothetical protein D7Y13_28250 [Corallococcus praedator]|uniref:Lipoprotein n=1 Tax=Corallococcus praedator TaxID=2316724 RepID=A0ABX9QD01_9BACT|nr:MULTISPECIES: hypothetical protein [Corallococcus]RKH32054.1 hypothetical protein D7X75_17150 [Corallococcus sp. CA031C]RKH99053.1 hypothetical protein D7Y13_28250 [Corallococcus praedator]